MRRPLAEYLPGGSSYRNHSYAFGSASPAQSVNWPLNRASSLWSFISYLAASIGVRRGAFRQQDVSERTEVLG